MQDKINAFGWEGKPIRIIQGDDGEPRWVAKDVAEALGYPVTSLANVPRLFKHVPEEWKGRTRIPTPGGTQEMVVITEPGLFFFLSRSDKAVALPFQKWIAGEVLPALRRTGTYTLPGAEALRARPRLSGAFIARTRERVGHEGTTAVLERIWPEWFANLPGLRPNPPQQVVAPSLGLVDGPSHRIEVSLVKV